jgi:WD repeat and SOF domain-containing protein 1
MERAREYTRALNAAKRERMFSQPFLFALDGHSDGIFSMSTVPTSLVLLASGACDGEIRMWHLGSKRTLWAARAHSGFVRGLSCSSDGELLVSCSNDNTVKLWRVALRSDGAATEQDEAQGGVALGDEQKLVQGDDDAAPDAWSAREAGRVALPVSTLLWTAPFTGVDFQRQSHTFATSGAQLDLWDTARSEPLHSFAWGADSITTVKVGLRACARASPPCFFCLIFLPTPRDASSSTRLRHTYSRAVRRTAT